MQIQIHRPDDETVEIYVGETEVAYANHDVHGWAGMNAVEETARRIANALGMEVIES